MRVFAGNTGDPATVAEQVRLVEEQSGVEELALAGDRGKIRSKGKEALREAGPHYIRALTEPQMRRLPHQGSLQLGLFHGQLCEVEAGGLRYLLRKNGTEAAGEQRRLEDKLAQPSRRVETRYLRVGAPARRRPEAGPWNLQTGISRPELTRLALLRLEASGAAGASAGLNRV